MPRPHFYFTISVPACLRIAYQWYLLGSLFRMRNDTRPIERGNSTLRKMYAKCTVFKGGHTDVLDLRWFNHRKAWLYRIWTSLYGRRRVATDLSQLKWFKHRPYIYINNELTHLFVRTIYYTLTKSLLLRTYLNKNKKTCFLSNNTVMCQFDSLEATM